MHSNEAALRMVYKDYYFMIEKYILSNSGNKEDARDIFQETMLSFYKNIKHGNYVLKSKISTYIYSISKNLWLKKINRKKKEISLNGLDLNNTSSDQDIQGSLEYSEKQLLIGKLLMTVGSQCSKILKLYYYERLKMKKIALEMGLASDKVAKNQKARCLKKLRAVVAEKKYYKQNLESL